MVSYNLFSCPFLLVKCVNRKLSQMPMRWILIVRDISGTHHQEWSKLPAVDKRTR